MNLEYKRRGSAKIKSVYFDGKSVKIGFSKKSRILNKDQMIEIKKMKSNIESSECFRLAKKCQSVENQDNEDVNEEPKNKINDFNGEKQSNTLKEQDSMIDDILVINETLECVDLTNSDNSEEKKEPNLNNATGNSLFNINYFDDSSFQDYQQSSDTDFFDDDFYNFLIL